MFGSRDRRSWCLLSPHELGLDPKQNLEPLSHSFVYSVFCTASVHSYYHAHVHMMGSIKIILVFANMSCMHLQFLQTPTLLYVVLQVASRLVPVNKPSV